MTFRHVYVHVPFCARRCSYCDFSIAVRRVVPVEDFVQALAGELAARFGEPPALSRERTRIDTLYLGGGTPSRLGGDGVVDAIAAVRRYASVDESTEVTIEANPEDVTAAIVAQWVGAGVNRVSLGVQSFDPQVLAWMHRTHDVAAVHAAVDALAAGGIANWSLDLIYALPGEVPRDWARDLDAAIALEPTHLSAYGLTVESGTPLARWRERGRFMTPTRNGTNATSCWRTSVWRRRGSITTRSRIGGALRSSRATIRATGVVSRISASDRRPTASTATHGDGTSASTCTGWSEPARGVTRWAARNSSRRASARSRRSTSASAHHRE
ncbi:MAG: radical SAM protein [Gemmatimonadetes bacterium]|nr:radical SAM protein [Gemmatimonadota bacterium]